MRKLALIMMAGALTVLISMQAFAQPSSKAAVAGGTLAALGALADASTDTSGSEPAVASDDTGFQTVMGTSIKVPKRQGVGFGCGPTELYSHYYRSKEQRWQQRDIYDHG